MLKDTCRGGYETPVLDVVEFSGRVDTIIDSGDTESPYSDPQNPDSLGPVL